jgi:hypothetical protein
MTPGDDEAPSREAQGLVSGLADQGKITSDLAQRRAHRDVAQLVDELRDLLNAYDRGELTFDRLACSADVVTGRMADVALAGVLS